MKIKKLKHIIKEHIKVLKEQDEMTLNHYLIQVCQNNYTIAPLFDSEENELQLNPGYGDLDIDVQNSLQQQFYLNLGTPTPEQAFWWSPGTGATGQASSGYCIQITPVQTTLPNFTTTFNINDTYFDATSSMILSNATPPLSTLYNSCDECMGGCQMQIENMENYQSFFEFCSKCDNYGGVYPSGTDELYEECCSECEGMEKYKCAASGGGVSATYEQSCVATWENDAPFNTLEACQASGCGEFDLESGSSEFQCSDFLNYNPTNSELWHEAVCSMFCNPWGSGIGPGFADAALSGIPNLDWEGATGPQMTGYAPVDDFNIFDPQYETSTIQGYYDPGGLCSLGCCEGLVNPSFGSASENYDVCNEPGNELDWGWLNYSQQEQDLICAMINNGGSIEINLMGSTITTTIPFVIAIDYNQCCSETGGMPSPDGMALLSKKLTQNDIDKLQTKLKKDEKKSQQLSKGNSQKMRMQKLAGIIKNKTK